jgi:hypothetical protein
MANTGLAYRSNARAQRLAGNKAFQVDGLSYYAAKSKGESERR